MWDPKSATPECERMIAHMSSAVDNSLRSHGQSHQVAEHSSGAAEISRVNTSGVTYLIHIYNDRLIPADSCCSSYPTDLIIRIHHVYSFLISNTPLSRLFEVMLHPNPVPNWRHSFRNLNKLDMVYFVDLIILSLSFFTLSLSSSIRKRADRLQVRPHPIKLKATPDLPSSPAPAPSYSPACRSVPVRREWRALSYDEQADYIRSVKCLARLPSKLLGPSYRRWDDFEYVHCEMRGRVHARALFLPCKLSTWFLLAIRARWACLWCFSWGSIFGG
jgi:hypothetical protein